MSAKYVFKLKVKLKLIQTPTVIKQNFVIDNVSLSFLFLFCQLHKLWSIYLIVILTIATVAFISFII